MANDEEIEAAIDLVHEWLSKGRLKPSLHHFGSYRSLRAKCGFNSYDDDRALEVINIARTGDPDAIVVLRHFALDHFYAGQPLPPNLREHVVDILEGRIPPRRKRAPQHRDRDYFIATGVLIAASRDFPLARGSSHSAWWVVAQALGRLGHALGERTVEDIWDAHTRVRSQRSEKTGRR